MVVGKVVRMLGSSEDAQTPPIVSLCSKRVTSNPASLRFFTAERPNGPAMVLDKMSHQTHKVHRARTPTNDGYGRFLHG